LVRFDDSVIDRAKRWEEAMIDPARRAKFLRELEQEFIPDYDALNMPAADKRAAYALENITFRVGKNRRKPRQDRWRDRGPFSQSLKT
jgi:hypothetical protein